MTFQRGGEFSHQTVGEKAGTDRLKLDIIKWF